MIRSFMTPQNIINNLYEHVTLSNDGKIAIIVLDRSLPLWQQLKETAVSKNRTFHKKHAIVEAIQVTEHNSFELEHWSNGKIVGSPVLDNLNGSYVQLNEQCVFIGDWIIKTGDSFIAMSQKDFTEQYEASLL